MLTLLFKIADTPTLRAVLARKGIPIEATGAVAPEVLARRARGVTGRTRAHFRRGSVVPVG